MTVSPQRQLDLRHSLEQNNLMPEMFAQTRAAAATVGMQQKRKIRALLSTRSNTLCIVVHPD